MKLTESHLRKIVRQELKEALSVSDRENMVVHSMDDFDTDLETLPDEPISLEEFYEILYPNDPPEEQNRKRIALFKYAKKLGYTIQGNKDSFTIEAPSYGRDSWSKFESDF